MAIFDFMKNKKEQERQASRNRNPKRKAAPVAVAEKAPRAKKTATPAIPMGEHFALIAPHVTERARMLAEDGQYTFRVKTDASKRQVKESVERFYNVHVTDVRVIAPRDKARRRGLTEGVKTGYKKAVVALRSGEAIDIF